ncbi:MAG: diacylglycerol kinase family lipid kinase [Paludibacteraceae bacterium]|nr:diacylglycerol kinase family lipid kinase [Paludibacteraceae bacterium]
MDTNSLQLPAMRLIVNPISGTVHHKERLVKHLEDALGASYRVSVVYTQRHGHALQLARQALDEGIRNIVAVGGDGTVGEVARALTGTDAVMGIVPMGSGNGLAGELGIVGHDAACMADILCRGKVRQIDCGSADGQLFYCTCGTGFDADVSQQFADSHLRGLLSYIRTSLHCFTHRRTLNCTLLLEDGTRLERQVFLLNIANISQYGNRAYIAPLASPDNGRLMVTIIPPISLSGAISLAFSLFTKRIHKTKWVECLSCRSVHLDLPDDAAFHLDGDPVALSKHSLDIEVKPHALRVFVP